MHDDFDAPTQAPSDFPADPIVQHDLLFWALVTIGLIVLACVLTVLFKEAERRVRNGLGDAIDGRAKVVLKALSHAARARQDEQVAQTQAASDAIAENFGQTLKLSADLNKVVDKLNKALEGTVEKDAPHAGHGGGPVMAGGTVINIAVNNGTATAGDAGGHSAPPVHAPPHAVGEPDMMSPEEKSESLWKAVQKLFSYWKNLNVVTAAFRAAQQQLMFSERWIDPRNDDRSPFQKPRAD
ncbi:hypothetical protein [Asticcacaulis benevestitus]|uniref:Uncharacterized protein n=1 Tax=Asticcacaulis benevestitus DSM 16100 = ATCC BAA-896 TaxID=1121022 RepID=V4RM23_9CAUL|nr:hypothetical protein [Asticcacaulis benevestitus]ESQ92323.1 hypothetical protein ABENE_09170 [Asticcacaulis benevestitus DSM 16100 = ATCC BAA-896]